MKRHKTKYPGVYYRIAKRLNGQGSEKIYYVVFKKNGKTVEEKVGRQYVDDITPAKANRIRGELVEGNRLTKREKKELANARKWTFDEIWKEYFQQKKNNKSITDDRNRYNQHIKPNLGTKLPAELVPLDIERIRQKMLKKPLKPQTIKHVLGLVKRLSNFAQNMNFTPGINFKIDMPKVDNKKTEDLTQEELSRLLAAIEGDSNRVAANIMKMALFTGMRKSEIFKLKWEDINTHRGFILIREPKSGESQKVPLNNETKNLLDSWPRTKGSPFVFPGKEGKERTTIIRAARRIRKNAGLPNSFRPMHGLRHVYASMLASSGKVDMYTLQKLLTHKSPQMTQRYAHLRDDALKRAANLAGDIINDAMQEMEQVVDITKTATK